MNRHRKRNTFRRHAPKSYKSHASRAQTRSNNLLWKSLMRGLGSLVKK